MPSASDPSDNALKIQDTPLGLMASIRSGVLEGDAIRTVGALAGDLTFAALSTNDRFRDGAGNALNVW